MYTYPIDSRDSRTAPQTLTLRPSKPASRDGIAQDPVRQDRSCLQNRS
jgi:hypothetical protein